MLDGILRDVQNTASNTQTSLEDALQDIEALKVQARDMVRYASELNERLTAVQAAGEAQPPGQGALPVEPEGAAFIRSSLAQLGLQMRGAPVTPDMVRDERKWHEELARELADVLQGAPDRSAAAEGVMRRRGVVGLDEVWGGWNRARGVGKC